MSKKTVIIFTAADELANFLDYLDDHIDLKTVRFGLPLTVTLEEKPPVNGSKSYCLSFDCKTI